MMRKIEWTEGIGRRLRLSCRQIAMALALTVAALAFVWMAVHTDDPSTASKPVAADSVPAR
jgi:hypothetical protein